jgi:hypothetical protein
VSAKVLDAHDDLAETAGLSSLTVSRLRAALEADLRVTLPPALLLTAATPTALAARLIRHVEAKRPSHQTPRPPATDASGAAASAASAAGSASEAAVAEEEEEDASLLQADAADALRMGELLRASSLCERAAHALALPLPPPPSPPPPRSAAPLLQLLAAVAEKRGQLGLAKAAHDALIAALGPTHADLAIAHAQRMTVLRASGDHAAADAAAAASSTAEHAHAVRSAAAATAAIDGGAWVHVPPSWPIGPSMRACALRTLVLVAQQIDALPDALGTAVKLRSLDVSSNALHELPRTLPAMRELRELIISGNEVRPAPSA